MCGEELDMRKHIFGPENQEKCDSPPGTVTTWSRSYSPVTYLFVADPRGWPTSSYPFREKAWSGDCACQRMHVFGHLLWIRRAQALDLNWLSTLHGHSYSVTLSEYLPAYLNLWHITALDWLLRLSLTPTFSNRIKGKCSNPLSPG